MNWLAHLYLSEPNPGFRIGNLLPDIIPFNSLSHLPHEFLRGAKCHREIDNFTDSHSVFRQSMNRIDEPFRRYASVLIDIFYDHVLSREWENYSNTPLPEFIFEVYSAFDDYKDNIPEKAQLPLSRMKESDLLSSYQNTEGIRWALKRMNKRIRRPLYLEDSVSILEKNYDAFADDFNDFFPELIAHISDWKAQ